MEGGEGTEERLVYSPTTTMPPAQWRSKAWKMGGYLACGLLTSLVGYFCGNGISAQTAVCSGLAQPPLPPPPRRLLTVETNLCPHRKPVPLSGGISPGGKYELALCKTNASAQSLYQELRLVRGGEILFKWQAGQWRRLALRIGPCHPYQRGRCPVRRGADVETCPHAADLKGGIILCFDQSLRLTSLEISDSVRLSRIEALVFLETCTFWRP